MKKNRKKPKNAISKLLNIALLSIGIYIGEKYSIVDAKELIYNFQEINYMNENLDVILNEIEDATGIDTDDNPNLLPLYGTLKNEKLDESEKSLIYSLDELIKDNPYMDKNLSYLSMRELDIEYKERPNNIDDIIVGLYSLKNNRIDIYNTKEKVESEIVIHEIIHSLFHNGKTALLPSYIEEGVTELLTNEYFASNPFLESTTYPFEIATIRIMCEMVGEEKVLKAYTTGNMAEIDMDLARKMGVADTTVFMIDLKEIFDELEQGHPIDSIKKQRILSYLDTFFAAKLKNTNDTNQADIYFYNRDILDMMDKKDDFSNYWLYTQEHGYYTKAYFSKKLKAEYPYIEKRNIDGTVNTQDNYQYTYSY